MVPCFRVFLLLPFASSSGQPAQGLFLYLADRQCTFRRRSNKHAPELSLNHGWCVLPARSHLEWRLVPSKCSPLATATQPTEFSALGLWGKCLKSTQTIHFHVAWRRQPSAVRWDLRESRMWANQVIRKSGSRGNHDTFHDSRFTIHDLRLRCVLCAVWRESRVADLCDRAVRLCSCGSKLRAVWDSRLHALLLPTCLV